jgi:hypothetical protein
MNTIPIKEPIHIYTYNPEAEVWHYFSRLTNYSYVYNILEDRIQNKFYGFDIKNIEQQKRAFEQHLGQETQAKDVDDCRASHVSPEYYEILDKGDIHTNGEEICFAARQAIELYHASQAVSLFARPIILY